MTWTFRDENTECLDRANDALRILFAAPDKEVNVFGEAGKPVEGNGVAANEKELSVLGV